MASMFRIALFLFTFSVSFLVSIEPFTFRPSEVPEFRGIPYSDKTGLVLSSPLLPIPNVPYPYNPSLIPYGNGYLLAFRTDPKWDGVGVFDAKIGLIELDRNMNPISSTLAFLDTGYKSAEDPRLFQVGDKFYVSYTKVMSLVYPVKCHIAVTQFDPETKTAIQTVDMSYITGNMEKNWTPFLYSNRELGKDELYFMYRYAPQRILRLTLPLDGTALHVYENKVPKTLRNWKKRWGEIRGGSPAIRVENEYMSFFHSSFVSKGIRYYVMGAVTFDTEPPFCIKRISPYPIFFKSIYTTPVTPNVWFYPRNHLRVIFPSGCVEAQEDEGKKVFYVVAGENDVAIRLITIDKEKLMNSLISVQGE